MPSILTYIGDQDHAPQSGNVKPPGGGHAVFIGGPGGRFVPGGHFAELVRAHEQGFLRGAFGLWFDHAAVVGVAHEMRGALATVLQRLFKDRGIYVMDELSVEWAAHYELTAQVGGHPAWLRRSDASPLNDVTVIACTVAEAFHVAARGDPMLLLPKADGGPGCAAQDSYSPLRRWAATYGMLDVLVSNEAEANVREGRAFPRERLAAEQARARETLRALVDPPIVNVGRVVTSFEPASEVDGTLAAALAQALDGPRVMDLGSVFDPSTHYDQNYYAGPEGHGIRYPAPDRTWKTYYGPAKTWDGNKVVARKLTELLPARGTLLDIGCGSGDFVNQMAAAGWEAQGIDISEAATKGNPRVICGDFTDPAGAVEQGYWDLVTALDFWEHIWLRDLDRLLDATRELLRPGGLHFAIICTRGAAERDFVAEPGVRVTPENGWLLVSGHVNVRDWAWWARAFKRHGFKLRLDLAYLFQVKRNEDPGLATVQSWQAKNLLVLERK